MLYNGQEISSAHRPQLFEKDPVDWTEGEDISPMLRKLYSIKQDPLFADSAYDVKALPGDVIFATHTKDNRRLLGWFPVKGSSIAVKTDLPDGIYENLLGGKLDIFEGSFGLDGEPVIIRV